MASAGTRAEHTDLARGHQRRRLADPREHRLRLPCAQAAGEHGVRRDGESAHRLVGEQGWVRHAPAVRPAPAQAVRPSASSANDCSAERSITAPPSSTAWPVGLWPPPRERLTELGHEIRRVALAHRGLADVLLRSARLDQTSGRSTVTCVKIAP